MSAWTALIVLILLSDFVLGMTTELLWIIWRHRH